MSNLHAFKNSNYAVYVVSAVFFILSLWGILNHELWLDEAHHYLLARDSASLSELLTNTRYEGHPIAWNLILYALTRYTIDPIWMQLIHITIMTVAVGLFVKKAPFSWIFKLLFIFGYLMFYEYNIISRNYSLGILLVFFACTFYHKRATHYITIALLLGLASNSHAILLILASSIMAMISWERLIIDKKYRAQQSWIGLFLFGVLLLSSVLQIIPPSDTSFFSHGANVSFLEKIPKSISPFFKSIVLVPDINLSSFWNSNLLVNASKPLAGIIAIISLLIPYLLLTQKKLMLYMYFGIFVTGIFFYITSLNAARYYGILYLFLVTALWFDAYAVTDKQKPFFLSVNTHNSLRRVLIYLIVSIHFASGVYAYSTDIMRPFTTAQQTAAYLKENNLDAKTIVTKACNGTALSAYIGKPIYFTKTNSFESFCTFNRPATIVEQGMTEVLQSIEQLLQSETESIIFISHNAFFEAKPEKHSLQLEIELIAAFKGSIINKGNHFIYEISKS